MELIFETPLLVFMFFACCPSVGHVMFSRAISYLYENMHVKQLKNLKELFSRVPT